jgi:hypothetical protein
MHAIHAILVELKDDGKPCEGNNEQLKEIARDMSADLLEDYGNGDVWDWREDDAGRWIGKYPDNVILGATEKNRFLKELDEFKVIPFNAAATNLKWLYIGNPGWRTKEQIEAGGFVELPNETTSSSGTIWSGTIIPEMAINLETITRLWNAEGYNMAAWQAKQIFKLIDGQYCFDSQFYSLPDYSSKIS